MPFESKKQARWMFVNKPQMAKEWANKTKNFKSLPESINQMNKKAIIKKAIKKDGKGGPILDAGIKGFKDAYTSNMAKYKNDSGINKNDPLFDPARSAIKGLAYGAAKAVQKTKNVIGDGIGAAKSLVKEAITPKPVIEKPVAKNFKTNADYKEALKGFIKKVNYNDNK